VVGWYVEQVLPRITDMMLGAPMEAYRARVCAGLSGDVLEIGFGSGRNLAHLPEDVKRVLAVEPSGVGKSLAAKRIATSGIPVEFVGDSGEELPLEDESVDHVLVTWTLCTIRDVDRALKEVRRLLRPGGTLHFVEHGRSPDPDAARWQDRLNPLWGMLFGGCHLNRSIDELVRNSGLELRSVRSYAMSRERKARAKGLPLKESLACPPKGTSTDATLERLQRVVSELAGFAYEGVAEKRF